MEELEKSDAENDEEMPVAGPEKASPFHSIRLTSSSNRNAIKAYVHSEQVVMAGSTLKMRLGEDAYTDNGVFIPKNSPVYGIVTGIDGERVNVKITHINLSGNILPFAKSVYSRTPCWVSMCPVIQNPKSPRMLQAVRWTGCPQVEYPVLMQLRRLLLLWLQVLPMLVNRLYPRM